MICSIGTMLKPFNSPLDNSTQPVSQAPTKQFTRAVDQLIVRDQDLALIVERWGRPKQMLRSPGFATLLRIILGQQVSLSAAASIFKRLQDQLPELTPINFLSLEAEQLKAIGFSRQKINYAQALAQAIVKQELDLDNLPELTNEEIRSKLIKIKGIGDWTVDMYLMTALQRLDIFPSKDLAVAVAAQEIKGLINRPQQRELELIAEPWRPYRSVATMILWHHYLNR